MYRLVMKTRQYALPSSYDQLRDAILYGRERTITLQEVQSALRSKELQKGEVKMIDSVSESLNVKKFKGKKPYKKSGETSKNVQSDQKETRSCHWCKKPGHLKKDCYAWKRKQEENGGKAVNSTQAMEEIETHVALNVMENEETGSWIMDSGCSFHMSPNLEWFDDIKDITGSVILANNQICEIMGIGSIRLKVGNGRSVLLSSVRYIPEVKRNLVSPGSLESKGWRVVSENGEMVVSKAGEVLMKAKRKGSLYYMAGTVVRRNLGEAHVVVYDSMEIWHTRLGHPAMGTVKELIKKGLVQCKDSEVDINL